MADISKCTGINCPLKDKCYMYTVAPGIWQSYFGTAPFTSIFNENNEEVVVCSSFWDNKNEDNG